MAENWIIEQTVELTRPVQPYVGQPVELMLPGDHLAHTLRIKCKERDMPVNLTGYTAAGYFKRTDGNTVLVVGSITGNVVDVTLSQECYAFAGNLRGVVRITNSTTDAKITLCDRLFHVGQAVDDGGTIDPGEVIPSLDDLLAEIDAMEQATAAAEAAAECIADDYSTSATYAVGDYALHNGGLYRCTTKITTAEAWTAAHWTQVVFGDEVSDVKSALYGNELFSVQPPNEKTKIVTNVGVGNTVTLTPESSNNTDSLVVDCKQGDVFLITGTGWGTERLWAFVDSSAKLISISGSGATESGFRLEAPLNAAKMVCNFKRDTAAPYWLVKLNGDILPLHIPKLNITSENGLGICNNNLDNLPRNTIYGLVPYSGLSGMPYEGTDTANGGLIITFSKESAVNATMTQIIFRRGGKIYMRQYWGSSYGSWSEYKTAAEIETALSSITSDISALQKGFLSAADTTALSQSLGKVSAKISGNKRILAESSQWDDLPTAQSYILFNLRYSDNWNLQLAVKVNDSSIYSRVTKNDGSGTIYTDWLQYAFENDVENAKNLLVTSIRNITGYGLIQFMENCVIPIGSTIGATITLTPQSSTSTDCLVANCSAGDKFSVTGYGWNTERLWAFVDSENKLLTESTANENRTNYVITAPTNAAKLIINARRSNNRAVYSYGSAFMDHIEFAPTGQNITSSTVSAICSGNANNIPNNNIYGVSIAPDAISNMPVYSGGCSQNHTGTMITFGKESSRGYGDMQMFIQRTGDVYIRNYAGDVWSKWKQQRSLYFNKALGLGDSICEGWRNENMGFIGMLGCPYVNKGITGATLGIASGKTQICTELEDESGTGYDLIIACGGINDYSFGVSLGNMPTQVITTAADWANADKSTVSGGLAYLLYLMITKYPTVPRYFLITNKAKAYPHTVGAGGYTQQELHDRIVAICKLYNVKVIDVYEESIINSEFDVYQSPTSYSNNNKAVSKQYVLDHDKLHPMWLGYQVGYLPVMLRELESAIL